MGRDQVRRACVVALIAFLAGGCARPATVSQPAASVAPLPSRPASSAPPAWAGIPVPWRLSTITDSDRTFLRKESVRYLEGLSHGDVGVIGDTRSGLALSAVQREAFGPGDPPVVSVLSVSNESLLTDGGSPGRSGNSVLWLAVATVREHRASGDSTQTIGLVGQYWGYVARVTKAVRTPLAP